MRTLSWLAAVFILASACVSSPSTEVAEPARLLSGVHRGESVVREYRGVEYALSEDFLGSEGSTDDESYYCIEQRGVLEERRQLDLADTLRDLRDAVDWWVEVEPSAFDDQSSEPSVNRGSRRTVTTFASAPRRSSFSAHPLEIPAVLVGTNYHAFAALASADTVIVGVSTRLVAGGPTNHVMRMVLAPSAGNSLSAVRDCDQQLMPALSRALEQFGLPNDLESTNDALAAFSGFPDAQARVDPSLLDGTFLDALDARAAALTPVPTPGWIRGDLRTLELPSPG